MGWTDKFRGLPSQQALLMQCCVQGCDFVGPRTRAYEHSKSCDGPLLSKNSEVLDAVLKDYPRMLNVNHRLRQVDRNVPGCESPTPVDTENVALTHQLAQDCNDPGMLDLHNLSY
jgi:hypothetical protein